MTDNQLSYNEYYMLELSDDDFQRLLRLALGYDTTNNSASLKISMAVQDYSTIDEMFNFLRNKKDSTIEGALLGDFMTENDEDPCNWKYWLKLDRHGRFKNILKC